LTDAAVAEADSLRSRANMTILAGLHSETISLGVAIRRDRSFAAHAAPEMGDADQRRDDEVIEAGLGIAILVGLPGRSGGKARWPIGQKDLRRAGSTGDAPGVGHCGPGRDAGAGKIAITSLFWRSLFNLRNHGLRDGGPDLFPAD
jgi:hypothetical protein